MPSTMVLPAHHPRLHLGRWSTGGGAQPCPQIAWILGLFRAPVYLGNCSNAQKYLGFTPFCALSSVALEASAMQHTFRD